MAKKEYVTLATALGINAWNAHQKVVVTMIIKIPDRHPSLQRHQKKEEKYIFQIHLVPKKQE